MCHTPVDPHMGDLEIPAGFTNIASMQQDGLLEAIFPLMLSSYQNFEEVC